MRSITQSPPKRQPPNPSCVDETLDRALRYLWKVAPRTMIAYDRSDGARSRRLMAKPFAANLSEIAINDQDRLTAIVVDCDLPPDPVYNAEFDITHYESAAAIAWCEVGAPRPNLVIVNRNTLHAHVVWLLDDPIHLSTQRDAPRFAHAIQRALTRLIPGGDPAYSWQNATIHNPWDAVNNDASSHRSAPYRLRELATYLDLEDEPRHRASRHENVVQHLDFSKGSRNESMHKALLDYARSTLSAGKAITIDGLWTEAWRLNARCTPALDDSELKLLVNSKWRYWGGRAPRDRAAELKTKREAVGRTLALVRTQPMEARRERARLLRAAGMTIATISLTLAIGERTVYRYVAGRSLETLIDVIPMQDIPGEGAACSDSEAQISQRSRGLIREVFAARPISVGSGRLVGRSRRRDPSPDDHEAICACGCQDRSGLSGFMATFAIFADTA